MALIAATRAEGGLVFKVVHSVTKLNDSVLVENCSAWPRLKLTTKIGLHTTHHHPPPTTTQTLRQQYLSCYWPDFDQTLNEGS